MAQVRARVEARIRREAAAAREPEPAPSPAPERGRGAAQPERESASVALPPSASFSFHGNSIYWSSRGGGVGKLLHASRRLLAPLVKFVFNIDPMVDALAIQARRNAQQAAFDDDVARRLAAREEQDALNRRAVESLTAQMERLAADMNGHRTLVAAVVERLDALERARAGEHAARPQGDPTPLPPRVAGGRHRAGEHAAKPQGAGQTDKRTDDVSPHAADTPSSSGQADERTDDVSPHVADTPSSSGQADERTDDASPHVADTPSSSGQADERTDDDAPSPAADTPSSSGQVDERTDDDAPPHAAAPPTPNR